MEMETEGIYRLAKPKKKGLAALLFSRFFVIAALILLQVAMVALVYVWLSQYKTIYTVFIVLFTLLMIFYLFNNPMDSSAKLTWMFIIAVMPIVGAVFLYFTQATTATAV